MIPSALASILALIDAKSHESGSFISMSSNRRESPHQVIRIEARKMENVPGLLILARSPFACVMSRWLLLLVQRICLLPSLIEVLAQVA